MGEQHTLPHSAPSLTRHLTTGVASAWGLFLFYLLFTSVLEAPALFTGIIAVVGLIVVWATLERKRWGRLALLGVSATILGLFSAAIVYVIKTGEFPLFPLTELLQTCARLALGLYVENSVIALSVLFLALVTSLWLRAPAVVTEFEGGKKHGLLSAQRVIALALVLFWGLLLVFTPRVSEVKEEVSSPADRMVTASHRPPRGAPSSP